MQPKMCTSKHFWYFFANMQTATRRLMFWCVSESLPTELKSIVVWYGVFFVAAFFSKLFLEYGERKWYRNVMQSYFWFDDSFRIHFDTFRYSEEEY